MDQIQRGAFVKPPAELDLPKKRVLKTNKTAYPYPLKMDPVLFVHKPKGQTMYDAATAVHADDSLIVDKKNIVEDAPRSPCVQARSEENIKPPQNKSTHERRYTTRTSEEKNKREENSREAAEDPDFDEYYDIEEKGKDRDEDEENFVKNASTHACMQTNLPIGRPEH